MPFLALKLAHVVWYSLTRLLSFCTYFAISIPSSLKLCWVFLHKITPLTGAQTYPKFLTLCLVTNQNNEHFTDNALHSVHDQWPAQDNSSYQVTSAVFLAAIRGKKNKILNENTTRFPSPSVRPSTSCHECYAKLIILKIRNGCKNQLLKGWPRNIMMTSVKNIICYRSAIALFCH